MSPDVSWFDLGNADAAPETAAAPVLDEATVGPRSPAGVPSAKRFPSLRISTRSQMRSTSAIRDSVVATSIVRATKSA